MYNVDYDVSYEFMLNDYESQAQICPEFGDLKESPSLGESSHVMFSRMAKYPLSPRFTHFQNNSQKL